MQGFFTLDDFRLVHAISEAGTLTGAASRLGVDHSTAFRRLGAIEKRLGAHLFERARDGYTPTPAGEAAAAAARRILDDVGDLERRLAGEDLRPSGLVRVTTTDTLIEPLAPILAAFRAAHPAITLEIVAANPFFTLTRRDADVAIRPAVEAPEGLIARRIGGASPPRSTPPPATSADTPTCRSPAMTGWRRTRALRTWARPAGSVPTFRRSASSCPPTR